MLGEPDEVVIGEDDAVAVVLGAVDREGLEVSDEDAYQVIHALLAHLDRIGALGPAGAERNLHRDRADRVVHWCHQRKEVVHQMNDCCSGTLEVAGR